MIIKNHRVRLINLEERRSRPKVEINNDQLILRHGTCEIGIDITNGKPTTDSSKPFNILKELDKESARDYLSMALHAYQQSSFNLLELVCTRATSLYQEYGTKTVFVSTTT